VPYEFAVSQSADRSVILDDGRARQSGPGGKLAEFPEITEVSNVPNRGEGGRRGGEVRARGRTLAGVLTVSFSARADRELIHIDVSAGILNSALEKVDS
jgi:hypothetical protein